MRYCIALEARLAGLANARPPARLGRATLHEAIRLTTDYLPDGAALTDEIVTRLEEQLDADPDQTIKPIQLLDALFEEFGIEREPATRPDEDPFGPIDPCATSPP